jgi:hypothetical protein
MRAQSHVVGVALLLGIALVAIGTLTVGIGTVVESQAATADANRVADGIEGLADAADRTGSHSQQLSFTEGTLHTEQRRLRVLKDGAVVETRGVDALVFENGDRRVTLLAGAVVQAQGESAWLRAEPQITGSETNEVLVVGAPTLSAGHVAASGTGGVTRTVRIDPTHSRQDLGTGTYAVAIETTTPAVFERHFEEMGAWTERKTFPGDDQQSVVAHFPGDRRGYLVVHDLSMEVTDG